MHIKFVATLFFSIAIFLSKTAMSQAALVVPIANTKNITSDIVQYTLLEQELMILIKNVKMEGALLAEDFEVWSDKNNDWQSKADWLKASKQYTSIKMHNLSVRNLADVSLVSFLLETTQGRHKKRSIQFVVDMWQTSTHKLKVRYVSDLAFSNAAWHEKKF